MDEERGLLALAGGELAVGTAFLVLAGGPIWAIGLFGSMAGWSLYNAVNG